MSKELTPEILDITQVYIDCGFDLQATCERLNLSQQEVAEVIGHPQSKAYINEVYLDTGYRNRAKLGRLLDKMIESKIEEAEETEMYTEADLLDLLKFAHKMKIDEAKVDSPGTQVNIANFNDSNYAGFVQKLMHGKS